MIKNFDKIKEQLKELSGVINSFKSEAVQLRIVELVFRLADEQENNEEQVTEQPPKSKRKKKRSAPKKSATPTKTSNTPKRASGDGAPATLTKLVEQGFFSKPKSIKDIVEHCEHNLARKFKSNEFSGKLARLVRDGTLKRSKNTDNQYEYTSA
ncbi:MAG: hypothetical protein LPH21_06380 [Shewanella sp.]|nr:hypothetical protein [Shewanella sp.]